MKLLKEKLGWRFILRSYIFPLHILVQIIGIVLLPLLLIASHQRGSTAIRTFPLSFWFGTASAFYNGAKLDPCNSNNCSL